MPAVCRFEPEARAEYNEAVRFYALEAGSDVAFRFIASVESALASMAAIPELRRVAEPPDIRCLVLFNAFPSRFTTAMNRRIMP